MTFDVNSTCHVTLIATIATRSISNSLVVHADNLHSESEEVAFDLTVIVIFQMQSQTVKLVSSFYFNKLSQRVRTYNVGMWCYSRLSHNIFVGILHNVNEMYHVSVWFIMSDQMMIILNGWNGWWWMSVCVTARGARARVASSSPTCRVTFSKMELVRLVYWIKMLWKDPRLPCLFQEGTWSGLCRPVKVPCIRFRQTAYSFITLH